MKTIKLSPKLKLTDITPAVTTKETLFYVLNLEYRGEFFTATISQAKINCFMENKNNGFLSSLQTEDVSGNDLHDALWELIDEDEDIQAKIVNAITKYMEDEDDQLPNETTAGLIGTIQGCLEVVANDDLYDKAFREKSHEDGLKAIEILFQRMNSIEAEINQFKLQQGTNKQLRYE